MFYQWFSFKKQSHLLSNLDSFFLTMVLSRHVLSYRIPWCYRTMSQSYLSPWCYRTMASSYLILFLTHPTFVIVPWNIYHTKIYCKWTSLFDRAYRANLGSEKVNTNLRCDMSRSRSQERRTYQICCSLSSSQQASVYLGIKYLPPTPRILCLWPPC